MYPKGTLVKKLQTTDLNLRQQHHAVTFHGYMDSQGLILWGSDIPVKFLAKLYNENPSFFKALENSAIEAALPDSQEELKLHCPVSRLPAPAEYCNYDELRKFIAVEMNKDSRAKGHSRPIYNYDESNKESVKKHEEMKPSFWPEHLIKWKNVKFCIAEVGLKYKQIPKEEQCPKKPTNFFRYLAKAILEAQNLDPNTFYNEENWAMIGGNRMTRWQAAKQMPKLAVEQYQPEEEKSPIKFHRPTPEELNYRDEFDASNLSGINMFEELEEGEIVEGNKKEQESFEEGENIAAYSKQEGQEKEEEEEFICHICGLTLATDESLCDCSSKFNPVGVHWGCYTTIGCTDSTNKKDYYNYEEDKMDCNESDKNDNSIMEDPEEMDTCHICQSFIMDDDSPMICNCLIVVHMECYKTKGCNVRIMT